MVTPAQQRELNAGYPIARQLANETGFGWLISNQTVSNMAWDFIQKCDAAKAAGKDEVQACIDEAHAQERASGYNINEAIIRKYVPMFVAAIDKARAAT